MRLLRELVLLAAGVIVDASALPESKQLQKRDAFDLFPQDVKNAINGIANGDIFRSVPSDRNAAERLVGGGIGREPVEVLNIPGYANFTSNGWNLRVRGIVYTRPYWTQPIDVQNRLSDLFVPDAETADLPPDEQYRARNTTSQVLLLPAPNTPLEITYRDPNGRFAESRQNFGRSDSRGEFFGYARLGGLAEGNRVGGVVGTVDYTVNGADTGNATGYLVPSQGITIVSDIDDILRVTKVWNPFEALNNTFVRPYMPWMNMPSVFSQWAASSNGGGSGSPVTSSAYHFHYLTTTPEQLTRTYMNFIYAHYPLGSFDTRPLNLSNPSSVIRPREFLLRQLLQSFPQRRFVLVGDTSNNDIMSTYSSMALEFRNVACVLIRNTTATDQTMTLPSNTAGFRGLEEQRYMFFRTPDDIAGLNFYNGECRRQGVPQTVTFGWQGGPSTGTWLDSILRGDAVRIRGRWGYSLVALFVGAWLWL